MDRSRLTGILAFTINWFGQVISVCNSSNQAIGQAKTPADVQGRVFAARRFTGQLTIPLAALIAGPLSDRLFEPAMTVNGNLAPIFGELVGIGYRDYQQNDALASLAL